MMKIPTRLLFFLLVGALASCSRKPQPFGKPAAFFFQDQQVLNLCSAILESDPEAIKKALEDEADINLKGREGMTPLLWTLGTGDRQAFEQLLAAGADPNVQMNDGGSVMRYVAAMDNSVYLRLALQYGGNANLVDPTTGRPPLLETMLHDRFDNMKMLVEANANLNFLTGSGTTPLIEASYLNRYDMVLYLLAKGADHTIATKNGHTLVDCLRDDLKNSNLLRRGELFEAKGKVIDLIESYGSDVAELRQLYATPPK